MPEQLRPEPKKPAAIGKNLNQNDVIQYYKELGWSDVKVAQHTKCIDFSKPVALETIPKGTKLDQWVDPVRGKGNYFGEPNTPASKLGIYQGDRILKSFVVTEDIQALRSTAAKVKDIWSVPGKSFQTEGGATQFFVKNPEVFKEIAP